MNTVVAKCGCSVPAVGAPGSSARRACESRTCDKPRCRSGLSRAFTDAECEAYVRLETMGFAFTVDLVTHDVQLRMPSGKVEKFANLPMALRAAQVAA